MSEQIKVSTLHNAALTTAAGATESTNYIALNGNNGSEGFFSVIVTSTSTGAGVLKVEPMVSMDGTTFYIPEDKDGTAVDDVVTAHAVGTKVYSMSSVLAPFVKVKLTATVANLSLVTVKICHQ